jgi:SAM-dependent methyltransferase
VAGEANTQQREYWNGDDAREWFEEPRRFDEMLDPFGRQVLERAALLPGERVLDVGCGNGAMTIDAARRVAPGGHALGIDLSEPMLDIARRRATEASLDDIEFVAADAQVADLGAPRDVLASRFGIMFFDQPDAAFTNLARALVPGGRLTFACWAPALENEWIAVPLAALIEAIGPPPGGLPGPDDPGPFRYGDPAPLVESLERAGLIEIAVDRTELPLLLGGHGSLDDAVTFIRNGGVARAILGDATAEQQDAAMRAIRAALEPYVTDDGVRIGSATWLVSARKP